MKLKKIETGFYKLTYKKFLGKKSEEFVITSFQDFKVDEKTFENGNKNLEVSVTTKEGNRIKFVVCTEKNSAEKTKAELEKLNALLFQ
jgi:hypothetical protein